MKFDLSALSHLASSAVDMLLPPRCVACAMPIRDQKGLCAGCWTKLIFIEDPRCGVSGIPFPYGEGSELVSPAALRNPPIYRRARGAVLYDAASRPIVQALKYYDRHEAAHPMARLMALAGRDLLHDADMLVPVPLHRWRL